MTWPDTCKQIGRRLATIRKAHGHSQADMAQLMGIPRVQYLQNREYGRNLTLRFIIQFVRTLGISFDDLFEGIDAPDFWQQDHAS